ncbi:MAG: N-acetylmannosamine-6-phosphate 2-epimerase [Pseudoflavonifractor sp.]
MGVMNKEAFFEQVKGRLIVSCQALPEEPLHSSYIMSRMAYAAFLGGAAGIRANTVEDIVEIRKTVDLPVIGIIKRVYPDHPELYITPTMQEVDELVACGVEAIALDATHRLRPGGGTIDTLFPMVRAKYPHQLFMADCSSVEEGMHAAELGFDLIGTTMASYTPYTAGCSLPPFDMIEYLVKHSGKPVVAEGNIITPEHLRRAMELGILTAVVGSAITRPMEITRRFVAALR